MTKKTTVAKSAAPSAKRSAESGKPKAAKVAAGKVTVGKTAGKATPTKPTIKAQTKPKSAEKAAAPKVVAQAAVAKAAAKPAVRAVAANSSAPQKKTSVAAPAPVQAPVQAAAVAAAPAPAAPKAAPAQPLAPPVAKVQPAPAVSAEPKKPVSQRHGFKTSEYIVYPAHGVGRIVAIEEQLIAGLTLELFVIAFDKDKMMLRVPTSKTTGMRKLAETPVVNRAMETLKGRARIKRTMWSRRAQEYEAKINSGDLIAIAEVVRDLYRSESQPEQSYSERQLYEAALDRMAREIAVVDKLDDRSAVQRITEVLARSARDILWRFRCGLS